MQLILCGGGSGEQNAIANQLLNDIIDHTKPILYIPLAMDENSHPYDDCYEWIKKELSKVDFTHIDMVRSFEELASKKLEDYTALFIGGGNVYRLLSGLKESGAFNSIKKYIEKAGIVIGGSAGAVIFGKDINVASSMDPNIVNLKDTQGFDVLSGISIFPHYPNTKFTPQENETLMKRFTKSLIEFSLNNGDVYAIPEEDAIYVNDDNIEVIGTKNYFYFKEGTYQEQEINKNTYLKKI